jgi:hypothetical protein
MIHTNQGIESILSDPNSSGWLKTALLSALDREPIDAVNDAEILHQTLKGWLGIAESTSRVDALTGVSEIYRNKAFVDAKAKLKRATAGR